MDEWHVGDPADWGDSVGVPDIPYMGYINDGEDEDPEYPENRSISKSKRLKEEALDLRDQGEYHGALLTINSAIELDGRQPDFYNVKAIILEDLGNYDEALRYYDIALGMHHSQLYKDNKARLLGRIANTDLHNEDRWGHAMECVNEALKITRDKIDRKDLLRIKADILEKQGRKVAEHPGETHRGRERAVEHRGIHGNRIEAGNEVDKQSINHESQKNCDQADRYFAFE